MKNKLLLHAITWMNLSDCVEQKKPDSKSMYCIIPFIQECCAYAKHRVNKATVMIKT